MSRRTFFKEGTMRLSLILPREVRVSLYRRALDCEAKKHRERVRKIRRERKGIPQRRGVDKERTEKRGQNDNQGIRG
jgi:hypothetical protein